MTPNKGNPKNIKIARQVVLRAVRETPVLYSTQKAGLIEVIPYPNVAKIYPCMTVNGIMDDYSGQPTYTTIANFCMVNVHLPEHLKVGEVANAAKGIVHIRDKRVLYPSSRHSSNSDNSVHAVNYKVTRTSWNRRLSTKPSRRTKRSSRRSGASTVSCLPSSRLTDRPSWKRSKNSRAFGTGI